MAENSISSDHYSLKSVGTDAGSGLYPEIEYRPKDPVEFRPAIGLIACGGITESHLTAYSRAGYNVVALCDLDEDRAIRRRGQFYPDAWITTDYRALLKRNDIEVVDIATHPLERLPLIEAALIAGKHVLSQKPFVLDLAEGERLATLANSTGRRLSVNQNGRWAPHFSYIRNAIRRGVVGELMSVHQAVHWDHTWTIGTRFEDIDDLILYDFAIHWFDILRLFLGDRGWNRVVATRSRAIGQVARPPMLAQAIIDFDGGQASLVFDAHIKFDARDTTYVGGSAGTIRAEGANLGQQTVTVTTADGVFTPHLEGSWFPDGFHGSMAELLCAIEEEREPLNSATDNLRGLELCFAAIASASDGQPRYPGQVRMLHTHG